MKNFTEWLQDKILKEMSDLEAEKILGVKRGAPNLMKVYMDLAKQNHPDKGGDLGAMQKINAAKDVLTSPPQQQAFQWPSNWKTGTPTNGPTRQPRDSGSPRSGHDYYNRNSKYKTPNSVPGDRRQEMEQIYAMQDQIKEMCRNAPKEILINFLLKIKPGINTERYSQTSNDSIATTIFSEYPTKGTPDGYRELIQSLEKELASAAVIA